MQLVFDTHLSSLLVPKPMPKELVRDYTVEALRGNKCEDIAVEKDNDARFRRHAIPSEPPVSALRITVTETWGVPEARILEIRAY